LLRRCRFWWYFWHLMWESTSLLYVACTFSLPLKLGLSLVTSLLRHPKGNPVIRVWNNQRLSNRTIALSNLMVFSHGLFSCSVRVLGVFPAHIP
jgi:hypothetical protein